MATTNLGRVSVVPKGEWNSETEYKKLDIVTLNGSSYIALLDNTNKVVTNTTYWQLIAEKGDKGDKGNTGDTGATGPTGNGIASITKTSTSGLVDTYTITYTNGTTTTFQITNGEDGEVTQAQLDETNRAIDYYKSTLNALPKVEGEGTSLTLDDTAEAPMPMTLSPGVLSQYTTTGKNLMPYLEYNSNDNRSMQMPNLQLDAGTYTISFDLVSFNMGTNTNLDIFMNLAYEDSGSLDTRIIRVESSTTIGRKSATFTLTSNTTATISNNIRISATQYDNGARATITNIQIESGSSMTDYESYTGKIPAPNPEFPETIHTISGDNEIVVENVNLANPKLLKTTINSTTGIEIANDFTRSSVFMYFGNATTIYLKRTDNTNMKSRWYDEDKIYIGSSPAIGGGTNISLTPPNNAKYLRITMDITDDNYFTNYNVIVSTIDISYVPYQSQVFPLNLPGGNLLIKSTLINNKGLDSSNGKDLYDAIGYSVSDYIKIEKNINYSISNNSNDTATRVFYYDGNKNFLSTERPVTIINSSTATYIRLQDNTSHFEDGYIIKESDITPLEYCKIGDYEDEFYLATESDTGLTAGKWYLKKNIGKVVLNGSEDIVIVNSGTENWRYDIAARLNTPVNSTNINSKSTHYMFANITSSNTVQGYVIIASDGSIRIRYGEEDTVEHFKNWLSTHNVIIYYILSTPEYILLNDTLQSQLTEIYNWVKAYQEQTNISQVNNDLPFVIKASAVKDLNKVIASLTNAIIEIGGE